MWAPDCAHRTAAEQHAVRALSGCCVVVTMRRALATSAGKHWSEALGALLCCPSHHTRVVGAAVGARVVRKVEARETRLAAVVAQYLRTAGGRSVQQVGQPSPAADQDRDSISK